MRVLRPALAVAAMLTLPVAASAAAIGASTDDGTDGVSALKSLAEANGHRTSAIGDQFQVPATESVMFVVEPDQPYTAAEARAAADWVSRGGVLVYAAGTPDPQLEQALGISRPQEGLGVDARATVGTPLLAGVGSVQMTGSVPLSSPENGQVAILRNDADILGLAIPMGSGRAYALASSGPLTNGDIANADNRAVAADFIAAAGPGAQVVFDEYHHSGAASQESGLAWMGTPWGLAILLEVALLFLLLLLRGRAFGPLVPLHAETDPSSAEFTSAVGAMLRRARAERQTVARLLAATHAALARRVGLRQGTDGETLAAALRQRAPGLADELNAATARSAAVHDEKSLAEAAAELHRLARPQTTRRS